MDNPALMNYADYSDPAVMRKLLRAYDSLYDRACRGDQTAAAVYVDIKSALYGEGVLTKRQRQCIILHLVYKTPQVEASEMLGISRRTLRGAVEAGIAHMQKFLLPIMYT